MKTDGKVVIELKEEVETYNILYYYIDRETKKPELLSIYEMHEKLYRKKVQDLDKKWSAIYISFNRFMYSIPFPCSIYLNHIETQDKKMDNLGFEIPTLPISINKSNIILGIYAMDTLSSQIGRYTSIYLRYNDKEEELASGRNKPLREEALKLLYSFFQKNKMKIQGIDVRAIDFPTFWELIQYIWFSIYRVVERGYIEYPEIYGELLLRKVKKSISE